MMGRVQRSEGTARDLTYHLISLHGHVRLPVEPVLLYFLIK